LPGKELVRSVADRRAAGRALRKEMPRSSHAQWSPASERSDPIRLLEEQTLSRQAQLVPIRYGRMAASPFGFLRGAAIVMAGDLAATPVTGLQVQMCGDAHLSNFGVYATPERNQVFDVNDFDETLPGPWEWDVKRLAASIVVAGRTLGYTRERNRQAVVERCSESVQEDLSVLVGRCRFVDVDHIVAGVGSVGRRCYVALLMGSETGAPLVLQIKQAQASVYESHLGSSPYSNHAQRVVS